jgi:hypothetical protein
MTDTQDKAKSKDVVYFFTSLADSYATQGLFWQVAAKGKP